MGEAPRPPGFPCPNCREMIVITLPGLLYADSIACLGFGTVLEMSLRAAPRKKRGGGKKAKPKAKRRPKPKPKRKRR